MKNRSKLKGIAMVFLCALIFICTPAALAQNSQFIAQDGFGYSGAATSGSPLSDAIEMTGYDAFPAGITGTAKFSGGVYDGAGNIWLVPINADRVVRLNTATGAMTGYDNWPAGFDAAATMKFRGGVFDGQGGLWLIPNYAGQIIKLDTATGVMTGYGDWPAGFDSDETSKFLGGVYDNGNLWLVPNNADRVVRLDTSTGIMTGYDSWPAGFNNSAVKFFGGVKDNNGNLWMIPCNANMVVRVSLTDGAMTGFSGFPAGVSAFDSEKFSGGVSDAQGNIWMIPNCAGAVVKVNTATGEMTGYNAWPESGFSAFSNKFSGGAFDGKNVWMSPQKSDAVIRLNTQTGEMSAYSAWPDNFSSQAVNKFAGGVYDGENVWLVPYSANKAVKLSSALDMKLSVAGQKVYAPSRAEISVQIPGLQAGCVVREVEYLRLKTNDGASVTPADYSQRYSAAGETEKNKVSSPDALVSNEITFNLPVAQNGIYWLRATIEDGNGTYSLVGKVRVDNIYTPCNLQIKGVDQHGNQLYSELYSGSRGVALESDGSLVAVPTLGYETVAVTAKSVAGYTVFGTSAYTVTFDNVVYLGSDNVYTFTYSAVAAEEPVKPPVEAIPPDNVIDVPAADAPETIAPEPAPEKAEPKQPSPEEENGGPQPEQEPQVSNFASPGTQAENPVTSSPVQASIMEKGADNTVVCTLTAISNDSGVSVYRYMIVDRPSANLTFVSGNIPAFNKGAGLVYSVLYKTNRSSAYKVAATGISAGSAYTVLPPGLAFGEFITELTIFFDTVPAGFAEGNVIRYTFGVEDENYSNSYFTYWNYGAQDRNISLATLSSTIEYCTVNYLQQNYTAASWAHYTEAVRQAQAVINDPYSTAEQINTANQAVSEAAGQLAPQGQGGGFSSIIIQASLFAAGVLMSLVLALLRRRRRKKKNGLR